MAFNLHPALRVKDELYCTKFIVSMTQSSHLLTQFRHRLAFYWYLQDALTSGKIHEKIISPSALILSPKTVSFKLSEVYETVMTTCDRQINKY